MIHVEKRTHWTCKGALLASAVASCMLVACATSKPVVHVVEVPLDQYQAPPGPAPNTPVEPQPVQTAVEPPAAPEPVEPNTGGHPTEIKGNNNNSDKVLNADCSKVFDRYAILKAVEGGQSMADATRALPLLRGKTHLNPAMRGFNRTCLEKYTKDQVKCAVKANQLSAWKSCLQ